MSDHDGHTINLGELARPVPEDRIVPEGWRVEWQVVLEATDLGICYSDAPVLVPSDTPHEEGAE